MATVIIDLDALTAAVDAARSACSDPRWTKALESAYDWLVQQDAVEFDNTRGELLINSPSGRTYHANGACQCRAYETGSPCWHRAASRLVKRMREQQAETIRREMAELFD